MKTIDELKSTAATVRDATEDKENTALRVGQLLVDMIDTLSSVTTESIKGYVIIDSTSDLPANPTPNERMIGYILDSTLYVYVGSGGDTLDGKYKSVDLGGVPGVGFYSVADHDPADGVAIITLTNGDTITLDLNHNHSSIVATGEKDTIKFHVCADETEYTGMSTKDSDTLYLIPESSS